MKIAVISDLHGNLLALEKFLKLSRAESFDEIICLGDVLDPFKESLDVYELLKAQGIPILRGNHEDYTINFHRDLDKSRWWLCDRRSIAMVAEHMGEARARELSELPHSLTRDYASGQKIYFCHASPLKNSESFFDRWTPDLKNSIGQLDAELIIAGHKHVCFERDFNKKKLIVVPSLGIPQSGLARPQFLTLQHRSQKWEHSFASFDYDPTEVARSYLNSGWLHDGAPFSWLLIDEVLCGKKRVGPLLRRVFEKYGQTPSEEVWLREIYEYLVFEKRLNFLQDLIGRKLC